MNQMNQNIFIIGATGTGCTPKSALDDALSRVGIHHFNLLPLTSVIPPMTNIILKGVYNRRILPGTVQPVVMAHYESETPGQVISAGIGWKLAAEGGVFIEVNGAWNEITTEHKLITSLEELTQRRDWDWQQPSQTRVQETTVKNQASSVLVCAIYDFITVWGEKSDD